MFLTKEARLLSNRIVAKLRKLYAAGHVAEIDVDGTGNFIVDGEEYTTKEFLDRKFTPPPKTDVVG